uniref:Expansin-B4 n=2 Tax=Zea mays TaxID=4577 RepID=A0A804LN93_MAIZE
MAIAAGRYAFLRFTSCLPINTTARLLFLGHRDTHRTSPVGLLIQLASCPLRYTVMATTLSSTVVVALGAPLFLLLVTCGSCARPVSFNASDLTADPGWDAARATWYGAPTGAGPDDDGGACGFKNVNLPPFSAMTSCGNEPLFKDGKGCGSCYQIRCQNHPACSGNPETVIITDMNYYPVAKYHFDLSGTAFGAMAKPGRNDELRHAGIIDIQFKRVPCNYPGQKVTFHVEEGSNPVYFAVLVEFEDGDGDAVQVDLMEANSASWTPMRESWGSIWRLDSGHRLTAPFSLRITNESGKTLVADHVIPANWVPNTYYRSIVQY